MCAEENLCMIWMVGSFNALRQKYFDRNADYFVLI